VAAPTTGEAGALRRGAELARWGLRALLLGALTAWLLDAPAMLGAYLYTEQFLALAAGAAAAMALLAPGAAPRGPWAEALAAALAALTLGVFGYVAFTYPTLQRALAFAPPGAVALALAMIVGVMAAVRRRTGAFLPLLLIALTLFALFIGPGLAPEYASRPVAPARLAVYLALDTNALFSKLLDIAAITVAPFIVFGFLLNAFGGAAVFSALAARLVGGCEGGAAKVSVLGSAAFGMVSGSAVANVAAVGAVSIPMMTRGGYRPHAAAAIEAVSSTGGQLMPPVMGAAAFLMAELLEVPYRDIALAALIPAGLYYAALLCAVDFEARRRRGAADAPPERPRAAPPVVPPVAPPVNGWRYLLAIAALVWLLFVSGFSAPYAGLLATAALTAIHLFWPLAGVAGRARGAARDLLLAMDPVADIVMLAAAAGLVIGVLNVTGVAFAVTLQMLAASGGDLGLLLALTALVSLALGLGMPTAGVYVMLATLAAPALIRMGVAPVAAHLYVLYFGMLSMITPPIAIASFAAATVAGVSPWRTAFCAMRFSAGLYAIPVAFVTQPALLMEGAAGEIALALARTLIAVALITAATVGHVSRALGLRARLAALGLAAVNLTPMGAVAPDAALLAALGLGALLLALLAVAAPTARQAARG